MTDLTSTFEWFAAPLDERDPAGAKKITSQLLESWGEIREHLGPERFDKALGALYAGKLTSPWDHAWVQTNGELGSISKYVNLTLEIDATELSLNVVGWFDPQLDSLERWLRKPAAWRFLRQLKDWYVVIFVRTAHVGKRVVYRGAPGVERERLAILRYRSGKHHDEAHRVACPARARQGEAQHPH